MTDDDEDRRRVDMTPAAECYLLSKYRLLLPMQLCCLPLPCPPTSPPQSRTVLVSSVRSIDCQRSSCRHFGQNIKISASCWHGTRLNPIRDQETSVRTPGTRSDTRRTTRDNSIKTLEDDFISTTRRIVNIEQVGHMRRSTSCNNVIDCCWSYILLSCFALHGCCYVILSKSLVTISTGCQLIHVASCILIIRVRNILYSGVIEWSSQSGSIDWNNK